jgi:hypothetical protein
VPRPAAAAELRCPGAVASSRFISRRCLQLDVCTVASASASTRTRLAIPAPLAPEPSKATATRHSLGLLSLLLLLRCCSDHRGCCLWVLSSPAAAKEWALLLQDVNV